MNEVPEYFAYGLDIEDFVIPNNIIEISHCAFEDCSILTNITIGSGTTHIYIIVHLVIARGWLV